MTNMAILWPQAIKVTNKTVGKEGHRKAASLLHRQRRRFRESQLLLKCRKFLSCR